MKDLLPYRYVKPTFNYLYRESMIKKLTLLIALATLMEIS